MEHVRYIDRTRDYYLSQGYDKSYEWAHFDDVPFTPLAKPLSECKVGLLGTSEVAVHFDPEMEENPIVEEHFRGVYSTLLEDWMGLDSGPLVNGRFEKPGFITKG